MSSIQYADKHNFLNWFMKNQKVNNNSVAFLLDFLFRNKDCLERFNFVSKELNQEGFVYIKHFSNGDTEFYFKNNGFSYLSPQVLIKDLTLDKSKKYFIFFDFEGAEQSFLYNRVNINESCTIHLSEEDFSEVERFIAFNELLNNKRFTIQMIDQAIDNNDKNSFIALSKELDKWENELQNFKKERVGV